MSFFLVKGRHIDTYESIVLTQTGKTNVYVRAPILESIDCTYTVTYTAQTDVM